MTVSRQSSAVSKEGVLDSKPVVSCNNGAGFLLGCFPKIYGKAHEDPNLPDRTVR